MRLEKTFQWRDTSGGVITKISSDIATQNSIPFAMNFEFDEDLGIYRYTLEYQFQTFNAGEGL